MIQYSTCSVSGSHYFVPTAYSILSLTVLSCTIRLLSLLFSPSVPLFLSPPAIYPLIVIMIISHSNYNHCYSFPAHTQTHKCLISIIIIMNNNNKPTSTCTSEIMIRDYLPLISPSLSPFIPCVPIPPSSLTH